MYICVYIYIYNNILVYYIGTSCTSLLFQFPAPVPVWNVPEYDVNINRAVALRRVDVHAFTRTADIIYIMYADTGQTYRKDARICAQFYAHGYDFMPHILR